MPAKIVVVEGEKTGTAWWVEDEVVRIGSGPQCQIRLEHPGVAPHAATLEFSEGRYNLYNRCDRPIRLGGRDVGSGASLPWAGGRDLVPAEGLAVRLVVDGDPAPAKRPAGPEPEDESAEQADGTGAEDEDEEGEEDGSAAKTVGQIVVTLLCVALIPVLLRYDSAQNRTPVHAENARTTFDALSKEIAKAPAEADAGLASILSTLQDARIADLRGKKAQSRALLIRALEATEKRRAPDGSFETEAEEKLYQYTRGRLLHLDAPAP